ncbi:ribonuclease H-like domain-containing protein [Tanacetum coccineum]|uniref:Ribonuclease H-like domain-containing protein n=1 Tax=Tanacetum coccineum TaxID=301880 RepID=A0ABQ5J7D4_9ASTR
MLAPSGGGLILYQAYDNLYAMTGRKAYLLEEKKIPIVGVFDEVSLYTLFRGSFGEETDKTTDLHQHLSRISTQKLETASQITCDAVTTHLKMASHDLQTASESKTTKEKIKSLALKAKVTREQTSDDSDSQGGSDEDINEEEAEAFNLLARNFCKFFRMGNRFRRDNRFDKRRGNNFGNKGGESSKQKISCYNCGIECHFASECKKPKENKAFVRGAWSDSEDGDEHQNNATCLMAIESQEVVSKPSSSNNDLNIIDLQKLVSTAGTSVSTGSRVSTVSREDENHDENANIPPPVPPTQQATHTLSTIKLPILKKGEYDIWAMKMEHYLGHTDYPIWEVIQKGNGPVQVSTNTNGQIRVLPPKIAKEILVRERERKARTTLLMSIPEDHLAKFHKMTDAKETWEAIKSKFCGNDESKKMQKYILKQQFESYYASPLKMPIRSSLDLYLLPGPKVFEPNVKGSTGSSSSAYNVAFVSSSTSSTNDVSTTYSVSTSSGHNSQREGSSSYTDELMYSFFANQSSGPQLDHEDLEQVDDFDLEEMDLKWQVAMISMRLKKFYKKTWRKLQSKGNQESRRRDAGNTGYKAQDNGRRPGKQEEPKALVTLDGDGVDWTGHEEDEQENFALIAYSNSGSDTEISANDKSRLGYGDQIHEGVLSYENEVLESVFDSKSSNVEDSPVYDRFAKVEGMHVVPPPMTRIYMPPKFDFGIDKSKFTYGAKYSKTSESDAKTSDFASCESNSSVKTLESVPKPAVNEPKAVSKPKVWSDAPIIEEYELESDDEYVIKPSKEQEKPICAFVNTVKHVKTLRKTVKEQNTCSPSPKADKKDSNGLMSKKLGLGYGFTRKACFVCGSFGHLIRDCDFHEKIMAKHVELNKQNGKGTRQEDNRPVWNNVQRLNHQNKFVPKADDPQKALNNKGIVDSRYSRHMTGNKAYLVEYQDYNGGHVAFEGSKGQITGKEEQSSLHRLLMSCVVS